MLKGYIKLFADKRLSFLRFHIWIAGILAAWASLLIFGQDSEILTTFVAVTIVADILIYKVFKLKESQFKDAEAFFQKTRIPVEQWDIYTQKVNACKIPAFCIALLCNIFVFKFPNYKLPAITSFEYCFIMFVILIVYFIIQGRRYQKHFPRYSSVSANQFQGRSTSTNPGMAIPMEAMSSSSSYQSEINPFHTVNHDFHDSSSDFQPISDITASSSFPAFEFHSSTTPNFSIPGYNTAGAYTGSDTAIGGISN